MQFIAAVPESKMKPAFTVTKLPGEREKVMRIFDKTENKIKSKSIMVDAGFLVTFARGHSIRCDDLEHVRAVGAGMELVPVLDEEGELKGHVLNEAVVNAKAA